MSGTTNIGNNALVTYNWNPATQLPDFVAAETAVESGVPGAVAKIIAIGDSTTLGVDGATDYRGSTSYPAQLTKYLTQDGVAAQSDNFLGGGLNEDGRLTLIGGAEWSGAEGAGGQMIQTATAGDGVNFTLNTAGQYNRINISYLDSYNGTATVSVNGGPTIATLQFGGSGNLETQTIDVPMGSYSELSITQANGNPLFIEGASLWNSTTPSIQVYNAGIGGTESSIVGTGSTTGYGEIQVPSALVRIWC